MTELGERLKEARKQKGYTLDDLQEITKIQKRYLAGIENEEFNSMPGSFYVRAFIKQYAEAVDLDPNEILAMCEKENSEEIIEEERIEKRHVPPSPMTRRRSQTTTRVNEVMPKVIVALFIIVIILAFAFLWKHKAGNNSNIPVEPEESIQVIDDNASKEEEGKPSDTTNDATGEEEEESQEEAQELTHIEMVGENAMYKLEKADTFMLEIRTKGPSWIGVTNENNQDISPPPGARTMQAGDTMEVDASDVEKVRIRVGRSAETEIYVNGELLTFASDRITQNIHIEFHKD